MRLQRVILAKSQLAARDLGSFPVAGDFAAVGARSSGELGSRHRANDG